MTQDELLELIDQAAKEEWTVLDLSGQELVSLPMQMGQLTQLTALNLSNNQLAEFPVTIEQLTQLTTLDLSNNQLSELPIAVEQLTRLTTLDLSSNQLAEFPVAIEQLTQLTTLDLSSNQLTELPEAISHLVNLSRLILYNNQLNTLPTTIDRLVNLNTLNLHYNQFTVLPEAIGNLIHLTTLNLRHNRLVSLPEEIGKLTKLTILNLRYNQLTQLPKTIGKLVNLAVLNLRHNQLTALPKEIGLLNNLGTLDLHDNQLTDLPTEIGQLKNLNVLDLYGNQLTKIPKSTSGLRHLTVLDLGDNQLTTLPTEIGKLRNLTTLDLSGNQLESLPESIGKLTQLLTLNLSFNQLTELPNTVGELTNLATLNLACNQIKNITTESIEKLTSLIVLDLSFNKLERLPQEIGQLSNLTQLDVNGNSFTLLPLESRNNARGIVNFYRQQLEQETEHLYEAKLLILGEPGAGKTTLSKKLQDPTYQIDHDEISTEGIDVAQWSFPLENGKEFWINTWDFGGQEIYHATHQFFLTKRSLYALVVDTRKEDTDFYYWLNVVELLSNHSPLLIIKNEKQDRSRDINERELRGQFPNLKEVLVTNLATNRNLSVVSSAIKHYTKTLSHVGTPLPKTWIKVREVLEQDPRNYISLEEYLSICEQNGFTRLGDKLQLSDYLHDLGVCLHFQEDELLRKTVILKPTWGSDAVYKVLDNPHVIKNQGRFNRSDLADIWNEEKYATMQYELLKLMMKFKLCYEIPSFPGTYIAPQLLSSNQPEYTWNELDNLILRYEYEFMPKGILTRLIVETHQWIEAQSCVWKTGVVLRKEQARAEVIEHYRYHKGEIKIRVSGRRKKELL
ncbi:MAG TPA: COR domain-containing protein, partial [Allocoleopsis sp.]